LSQEFRLLESNYSDRVSGLGKSDRTKLFDNALYHFLMKDYEKAALDFRFLVHYDVLKDPSTRHQAQWYLAVCAFEIRSYTVSANACMEIIDEGSTHTFFDDSVRRLLEIYGIVDNQKEFQHVYERFILSGQVQASDQINYTIGKSLYWQGKSGPAKSALMEILEESPFFVKSQYILGGILAEEGDYALALDYFKLVSEAPVETEDDKEIHELSLLAMGRVHYENNAFDDAIEAYKRLPAESDYYPDLLYEMSWTYIKQEAWEDAARLIDVFLLAYPEHDYSVRLRVIQGDIYMLSKDYEKALVSYENVIKNLDPVRHSLEQLAKDDDAAIAVYTQLLKRQAIQMDLPEYAVEALNEEDNLRKSIDLDHEMKGQGDEIAEIRATHEEISTVLKRKGTLGSFDKGRKEVIRLREQALYILVNLLQVEMQELIRKSSGANRSRVKVIQDKWRGLFNQLQNIIAVTDYNKQYLTAHRDQIRAVQDVAMQLKQVLNQVNQDLKITKDEYALMKDELPEETRFLYQSEMPLLEEKLAIISSEIATALSQKTTSKLMATVQVNRGDASEDSEQLRNQMNQIHRNELSAIWSSTSSGIGSEIDALWTSVNDIYMSLPEVEKQIDQKEGVESKRAFALLQDANKIIVGMENDHVSLSDNLAEVGKQAALNGFQIASDKVLNNVIRADLGVVNIYWTRKSDADKEYRQLTKEKKAKQKLLDERFDYINSKIGDD